MKYMNDFDIDMALRAYANDVSRPNLGKVVRFLADFKEEVDGHSDGWAYWRAPVAAARQLMELIPQPIGLHLVTDVTEAQYRKALGPIRSFMTRKGVAAGMQMPATRV